MNYYAIINGVNALLALITTVTILYKRSSKPIPLTYASFSFLVFLWAFFYFLWASQTNLSGSLFWLQMLLYPICFLHAIYFHFVLIFSDNEQKHRKQLLTAYLLGFVFTFLNFHHAFYDLTAVRNKPPFPYWPHATRLLDFFIAVETYYLVLSFIVLHRSINQASEPLKTRLKYFLIFNVVGWAGGLINWFYWYDLLPIPPIGNFAVTLFLLGTSYLILKHDLFHLNLAVRKTFLYAVLTAFIASIYALCIIISEYLFRSFIGYTSIIGTLLAGLTIALLFNPLRSVLTKFIDRSLFGRGIVELADENSKMRNQILKQDQMKAVATLAAGMAHEVRNPLTAIKAFTEHLPQKSNDPHFIKKFTEVVGSEINKIDSIVKQLLEFSKPSALTLSQLDLRQVVDETLELLNSELIKHQIRIEKNYDDLVHIRGDKKQLKQALLNLFLNSIDAMPNGGVLTVSVDGAPTSFRARHLAGEKSHHDKVTVTIQDTGIGIPKENIPHLFDPFFTTKPNGTGLGLSIVHGIIKEHGGKIEVSSTSGVGTMFMIQFKLNSNKPHLI